MGEGHGNMSKSELGSTEGPGRNVRAKSGLNKSGHAHGACEVSGAVIPQQQEPNGTWEKSRHFRDLRATPKMVSERCHCAQLVARCTAKSPTKS